MINAEKVSMVFAFEMSAQLVTEHSSFLCCQAKGFYKQQK